MDSRLLLALFFSGKAGGGAETAIVLGYRLPRGNSLVTQPHNCTTLQGLVWVREGTGGKQKRTGVGRGSEFFLLKKQVDITFRSDMVDNILNFALGFKVAIPLLLPTPSA